MTEVLPATAQRELEWVIQRLVEARKTAGLSEKQVEFRLSLEPGVVARVESCSVELSLRMFLVLCELYDVSPAWVLTGSNPYVDVKQLGLLTHHARWARDQLAELCQLIERVPAHDEFLQARPNQEEDSERLHAAKQHVGRQSEAEIGASSRRPV